VAQAASRAKSRTGDIGGSSVALHCFQEVAGLDDMFI
jgi:aspartyl aminopeptidase